MSKINVAYFFLGHGVECVTIPSLKVAGTCMTDARAIYSLSIVAKTIMLQLKH